MEEITVSPEAMQKEFMRVLTSRRMPRERAQTCASIFTANTAEGVFTHGVYRFPRFVEYIDKEIIRVDADPVCGHSAGVLETWDGHFGPGPTNALHCTHRAMELADQYGMGCVAIAHTNHWMRGGTYGTLAAANGYAFIGWTNTTANLPAWGARDAKLGNNPLVIAVPHGDVPVVLDMAMSQYSYGAMELARAKGEQLPVPGGYDVTGKLSDDPEAILESRRALPVGFWKGSGLALVLDLLAVSLSGGLSTSEISRRDAETDVSQVFIAISLASLPHAAAVDSMISNVIADYQSSAPDSREHSIRYPGEKAIRMRAAAEKNGIPVMRHVWEQIQKL